MFRFSRKKILPLFLAMKITVAEFSRRAGISFSAAERALNGRPVGGNIIGKVADALGIEPLDYLDTAAQGGGI